MKNKMKKLFVKTASGGYDVIIKRNSLSEINEYFNYSGKVLIVTDSGVPEKYVDEVKKSFPGAFVFKFTAGENSKTYNTVLKILKYAHSKSFNRSDVFVALGGGVTGDVTGFASSVYMRGINFVNIPTTLLSQVDSSVGGKTGIDFCGVKNLVGSFYQPSLVIVDLETLKTLDDRQYRNGIAEIVKIAVTCDSRLFSLLETRNIKDVEDEVIFRALQLKAGVVEKDENDLSFRHVLNFGHSFAHAVESSGSFNELLHGECVSLGILPMCSNEIRNRVKTVLEKNGLPVKTDICFDSLKKYILLDKKSEGELISEISVNEIGTFYFEKMTLDDLIKKFKEVY